MFKLAIAISISRFLVVFCLLIVIGRRRSSSSSLTVIGCRPLPAPQAAKRKPRLLGCATSDDYDADDDGGADDDNDDSDAC